MLLKLKRYGGIYIMKSMCVMQTGEKTAKNSCMCVQENEDRDVTHFVRQIFFFIYRFEFIFEE